jgi:hypothetical protein
MLVVLGLISWLLPQNTGQSDPHCGGASSERCVQLLLAITELSDPRCGGVSRGRFLILLPNTGRSDPLDGGARYGRCFCFCCRTLGSLILAAEVPAVGVFSVSSSVGSCM